MIWNRIEGDPKPRTFPNQPCRKARYAARVAKARAEYTASLEQIHKS